MSGKKFDSGKSPVVQGGLHYFPRAIMAVAAVSDYGANKYDVPFSEKNWELVSDGFNRYTDGLGRHLCLEGLEQYDTGTYDPTGAKGSELLHAAHVAWNALARLEKLLADGVPLRMPAPLIIGAATLRNVEEDDGVPF